MKPRIRKLSNGMWICGNLLAADPIGYVDSTLIGAWNGWMMYSEPQWSQGIEPASKYEYNRIH